VSIIHNEKGEQIDKIASELMLILFLVRALLD